MLLWHEYSVCYSENSINLQPLNCSNITIFRRLTKTVTMARPIKETPVLKGSDAKKFVEDNKNITRESGETRKRINENYNALKEIARF